MSDVFISYKREDQPRAAAIVSALRKSGLSVWYDAHIDTGSAWRQSIEDNLNNAKCVIVLWSEVSVTSQGAFIHDEAGRAQARGILLPVAIDPVQPPLGFGETQALNLVGWKGDRKDPRFQSLVSKAKGMVARAYAAERATRKKKNHFLPWTMFGVGAALSAGLAAFIFDFAGAQRAVCSVDSVQGFCSQRGLGGQPTPVELEYWNAMPAGQCAALQAYVDRWPKGAYAEEAKSRLAAPKTVAEPSVEPQVVRLPVTVAARHRGSTLEAAQQRALSSVTFAQACGGLRSSGSVKVTHAVEALTWECSKRGSAEVCGFKGQAVCTVETAHVVQRQTC